MNLWGIIKGLLIQDSTDRSKELSLEVDPTATANTRMTIKSAQTADREILLPDSDSTLADIDSAQTLSNKSIDADTNTISNLEVDNLKAGVLNLDLSGPATDSELPSALAVKTALDAQNEAIEITYDNTSSGLTATDVQAAIDEVEGRLDTAESNITTNANNIANHLSDAVDAHDASAISNVPFGNLVATDVQAALNELQTEIDGIVTGGEANTASNLGAGNGVFASKVGVDLQFKSLVAGTNITLTPSSTEILIDASGGSGANASLSNLSAVDLNQDLTTTKASTLLLSHQAATQGVSLITANNGAGTSGTITLQTGTATTTRGNVVINAGALDLTNAPLNSSLTTTSSSNNIGSSGTGFNNVYANSFRNAGGSINLRAEPSLLSAASSTNATGYTSGTSSVGLWTDNIGSQVYIETKTTSNLTATGSINISTGNNTNAGAGNSGNILLTTGSVVGGTRGKIYLDALAISPGSGTTLGTSTERFRQLNLMAPASDYKMFIGYDNAGVETSYQFSKNGSALGSSYYPGAISSDDIRNVYTTGLTSGGTFIGTANNGSGVSQGIALGSGNGTTTSGSAKVVTGNASSGNSGDITLQTGTATSTRGSIILSGNKVDASASTGAWRVPNLSADPASPVNGDIWYNTTSNELKARINSVTVVLNHTP